MDAAHIHGKTVRLAVAAALQARIFSHAAQYAPGLAQFGCVKAAGPAAGAGPAICGQDVVA